MASTSPVAVVVGESQVGVGKQVSPTGKTRDQTVCNKLLTVKRIEDLQAEHEGSEMHRSLGAFELTMLGIGDIVGTGIFVLTGTAAANNAGPAVVLSFVVAGIASMFAALCYSELAAIIPIAGSAYTYTYATMGELIAWTIGWDLVLEYLVGAATVCCGWSAYFRSFLHTFGIVLPHKWTNSPIAWDLEDHKFTITGNYVDLPAMAICLIITAILVFGVKESARFNNVIVFVKILVVVIFVVVMAPKVDTANWHPFFPPNEGSFGRYGVTGMLQGATTVFFSYIGFDAVSTCAQECKKPERDLPIGTLSSLAICTTLYIAVCLVATGLVPYYMYKGVAHPISFAVEQYPDYKWLSILINVGAIAGLTSVILVSLMGQPRIFYAMAKDGLFPKFATRIHPRYKTPYVTTLISGTICAVCAGVLPIDILGELTSIGTLFAFVLVCLGVLVLRVRQPDLPRKFKVPGGPYLVPLLGAGSSGLLVCTATIHTIERLFIWMALGFIIYFMYGYKHATVRTRVLPQDMETTPEMKLPSTDYETDKEREEKEDNN